MTDDSQHSTSYALPFPTLQLGLSMPDSGSTDQTHIALVDTGADITLVPLHLLKQIGARPIDEVRLRSHWGESTSFITYIVDVRFENGVLPGIEVVGDPHNDEILLGRNILNMLILLVDGPGKLTSILEKRPTR